MKKLTGSDIITLTKTYLKDNGKIKDELFELSKKDFDSDDLLVGFFFKLYPGGFNSSKFKSTDNDTLEAIVDLMSKIKKEISSQGIRKAYGLIQNIKNASNEAVELENKINDEVYNENETVSQLKAAQIVNFLSKYISGNNNKTLLSQAYKNINSLKLEEAGKDLHQVFANLYPEKNIKLAYVTLKDQIGESYQLCPKGIYIWGNPVPMPISNCRDYCIDSRNHPDGTVSCNYLKWLNENLMTNEQAKNLFDKIPVEHETMNLEKGERTKFPMSDQDSQDQRMSRKNNTVDKSWEEQLEEKNKKTSVTTNVKKVVSDNAIEALLMKSRHIFDDDELNTLENQLREAIGE